MNTSNVYLEHANITVSDIEAATRFFQTAFPEFQVRGGGEGSGREWRHIGTDSTYVALTQASANTQFSGKNYEVNGMNHIGFVVSDVESIADRLLEAGYSRSYPKQVQRFRIRDYFLDMDGNEYEFVQYLSENAAERNDYSE